MPALIPDGFFVGLDSDGNRPPVSVSLIRELAFWPTWLAAAKPRIHAAWGHGVDCDTVGAVSPAWTVTATNERNRFVIGKVVIPRVGNATGDVRLWIRLSDYASGTLYAGLAYRPIKLAGTFNRAGAFTDALPWLDLGASAVTSADKWQSVTMNLSPALNGPVEVVVYLTTWNGSSSPAAQVTVLGWVLASEGTAFPETYSPDLFRHFRRQTGVPDDVHTLRAVATFQSELADQPMILAAHSFGEQSTKARVDYVIPAPMHGTDLTVYVRAKASAYGGGDEVRAHIGTSDPSVSVFPSVDDSAALSSTSATWYTLTLTPTAGVTNYLTVWIPQGGTTAPRILDVYAVQDTVTPGTGVPGLHLLPVDSSQLAPGYPIVGSWVSRSEDGEQIPATVGPQNEWTDRFALANNTAWWRQTRAQITLGDHPYSGDLTTTAAFDASVALLETKVSPAWDASHVGIIQRHTTDGVTLDTEGLRAGARLDGTDVPGRVVDVMPAGFVPLETRVRDTVVPRELGPATVTPGTTHALTVSAGWVDANGTGASSSVTARLESVTLYEQPPVTTPPGCSARGYAAPNASIPDNDLVTGASSGITVTRAFRVGMVRPIVQLNHPNHAQLKLTISDGTTTRTLANVGDLSGSGRGVWSFSDTFVDDTAPAAALSAFQGSTSAATWTLKAFDGSAGSTGTLERWALELW